MNEEEKQAIEILNSQLLKTDGYDRHQKAIDIVLNLIEKQQKEIEVLKLDLEEMTKSNNHKKKYWVHKSILNSYVSKDKIKEKIKEVEERRLEEGECELALHGFMREAKIEVLKELLGE